MRHTCDGVRTPTQRVCDPTEATVRTAFQDGRDGDMEWANAADAATAGFVLASRQCSTDIEHVNYMLEWNALLVEEGFGSYVREFVPTDPNTFMDGRRTIAAELDEHGEPKVSIFGVGFESRGAVDM